MSYQANASVTEEEKEGKRPGIRRGMKAGTWNNEEKKQEGSTVIKKTTADSCEQTRGMKDESCERPTGDQVPLYFCPEGKRSIESWETRTPSIGKLKL